MLVMVISSFIKSNQIGFVLIKIKIIIIITIIVGFIYIALIKINHY